MPTHHNPPPKPKPKSRRSQHRHNTKPYRTWLHSIHRKSTAETMSHTNMIQRILASVLLTHKCRYNLHLNPSCSPFQNAITNISNTPTLPYFSKSKLAFHDLIHGKIVPPLAKSVLGLGMKFICMPPHTKENLATTTTRLERNVQLKVFFAHHTTTNISTTTPKLYVKSLWMPPPTKIPPWVDTRLSNFFTSLRAKFNRHKAIPKLLPYQRSTLQSLQNNPDLLFPDTDKGLGPCAVSNLPPIHHRCAHPPVRHINLHTPHRR